MDFLLLSLLLFWCHNRPLQPHASLLIHYFIVGVMDNLRIFYSPLLIACLLFFISYSMCLGSDGLFYIL
jgi:hypothetical protein